MESSQAEQAEATCDVTLRGMNILAVDDSPTIRKTVETLLKDQAFEVFLAGSGEEAINALDLVVPDLVLLDIVMPGMNGIEACKILHSDRRMKDVPILMLTSETKEGNLPAAFRAGARDFIAKPVDEDELLARVSLHLRLKNLIDRERNLQLELQAALQQKSDLAEARRSFLRIAAHDLRSPLTILTYAHDQFSDLIKDLDEEKRQAFTEVNDFIPMYLEQVFDILDRFLSDSNKKMKTGATTSKVNSLARIFDLMRDSWTEVARAKNINLVVQQPRSINLTCALPPVMQIVGNFISNAITYSPKGTQVTLAMDDCDDGSWRIVVRDQGPGVKEEERHLLFNEGGMTSNVTTGGEASHGVGLFSTRSVALQIGAEVGVEFPETGGSLFWLKFNS